MDKDENRTPTYKEVKNLVFDAAQTILDGMEILLKEYATKKDLDQTEKSLTERIDKVDGNVLDVKRRVIDLEHDTVTQKEFDDFKTKVNN